MWHWFEQAWWIDLRLKPTFANKTDDPKSLLKKWSKVTKKIQLTTFTKLESKSLISSTTCTRDCDLLNLESLVHFGHKSNLATDPASKRYLDLKGNNFGNHDMKTNALSSFLPLPKKYEFTFGHNTFGRILLTFCLSLNSRPVSSPLFVLWKRKA